MATTREDIQGWFERGKEEKQAYLIVVCDGFDHEDYPTYVATDAECLQKVKEYNGKNMQRVMEVYDLRKPMKAQLDEYRVWNTPEAPKGKIGFVK